MTGHVLITGGCGYIGCRLVPLLLRRGYQVRVLDRLLFGDHLSGVVDDPAERVRLEVVEGDIRDRQLVRSCLRDTDAVVHLAAMANDPSADLAPELTRQINRDAVLALVEDARSAGVRRFVNASTATIYGLRSEPDVTEDFEHRPITLYGQYKSETDHFVGAASSGAFTTVCLRAATVCGWSPRLRLDLTVNMLALHALHRGRVTVFGGQQLRPNIVIDDLVRAYALVLEAPAGLVAGEAFNVAADNHSVLEIARIVRDEIDPGLELVVEPHQDHRSYHIAAHKIRDRLGFEPRLGVRDAIRELGERYRAGAIPNPEEAHYRNVDHIRRIAYH